LVNWAAFFEGIKLILNVGLMTLSLLGVVLGVVLGMIPGLSATIGIALMLPMSYYMDPLSVMVLMLGIYTGGLYGGSISGILINTPGTPGAVCTTIEGYPLNKQGKGLLALFLALISSVTGGFIGIIFLLFFLQILGAVVLKMGPPEMFMIAFLALGLIATIRPESMGKTFLAGCTGIIIGNIGVSATGLSIGTLGQVYLLEGIPFVPALIALFAFPEIFYLIEKEYLTDVNIKQVLQQNIFKELVKAIKTVAKYPVALVKSSIIGVFVGMMPATGASVASILAYGEARRTSQHPELFGEGAEDGIIAAEAANNASEGSSLLTALVLGIPGSAATAMMIAALALQGISAGPRMIIQYTNMIYGVIAMEFVQMLMLFLVGITVIYLCFRVVAIPTKIIAPCLVVLCLLGAYANRFTLFDVGLVIVIGLLGYFLRKLEYPIIALVIGLLLGRMLNNELIRVAQRYAMDFTIFFTRPISLLLLVLTLLSIARSLYIDYKRGLFKSAPLK